MTDLVLWVTSLMHLTWGCLNFTAAAPLLTTGLSFFPVLTDDPHVIGLMLIAVAVCAIVGIGSPHLVLWSLPQQALLVMASLTALHAAWLGRYPDGTLRPGLFIFDDQLPAIALAIIHTGALLWPRLSEGGHAWTIPGRSFFSGR